MVNLVVNHNQTIHLLIIKIIFLDLLQFNITNFKVDKKHFFLCY